MGSVSPLLAIYDELKEEHILDESLWIGTKKGPEEKIIEKENIKFEAISAGKLRRYFDLRNISDLLKIKIGFWQAFFIIKKFKPDVILTAGSFVSVPVAWAANFLKVPVVLHQQDLRPGLANKLMIKTAKKITVSLDKSLNDFPANKVILTGNPIRKKIREEIKESKKEILKKYSLKNDLPVILIVGGGTGAQKINEHVWSSINELTKFCQIIHIAGQGKVNTKIVHQNYKQFDFVTDKMSEMLKIADVVISRAGMSFLTELAYFNKQTIIIPLPNSHQEENAKYFEKKDAGVYIDQNKLTTKKLINETQKLISDKTNNLGKNMHNIFVDYVGKKNIEVIKNIIK